MKMRPCALAGLTVTLLYCSQRSAAGGTLPFLTMPSSLSNYLYGDDYDSHITCNGGFKFGNGTVYDIYVSTNGYISMGVHPYYVSPVIPGEFPLVSPYGGDINPRISRGGSVRYTEFTSNHSHMIGVNDFIQNQTGCYFNGTKMMVAFWSEVAAHRLYEGSTFQCILITDGSASYAVFIYKCHYLGWGGAAIGWQANEALYEVHYLSGANSSLIGCRYSSTFSAIVYRLDEDTVCDSDEFTCDNGNCVPESCICNRNNDCGDDSDEQECPCYLDEFECDNGKCVPQVYICNGEDNCRDNSDEEQGCPCGLDEFTCGNGKCVPQSNVCDKKNDCKNNNDEEGCDDKNDEDDEDDTEKDGVSIGLVVGLPVGLFFLSVFISIIIMCVMTYCVVHTRHRNVQSLTQPSAEDSTTMISKKETSFTA